jgi:hypothetical protein
MSKIYGDDEPSSAADITAEFDLLVWVPRAGTPIYQSQHLADAIDLPAKDFDAYCNLH